MQLGDERAVLGGHDLVGVGALLHERVVIHTAILCDGDSHDARLGTASRRFAPTVQRVLGHVTLWVGTAVTKVSRLARHKAGSRQVGRKRQCTARQRQYQCGSPWEGSRRRGCCRIR